MAAARSETLQAVIDGLRKAVASGASPSHPAIAACERIFDALANVSDSAAVAPAQPGVCHHLDQAFATARQAKPHLEPLVDALQALSGSLHWAVRAGSEKGDPVFGSGHANAVLVGRGGLEPRSDVRIGLSLLAPNVRYPDHRHPPEEVYVVLSEGDWKQDDAPWFTPGIGGVLYNSPGIRHAMRASKTPLLAAWLLWDAPFHA